MKNRLRNYIINIPIYNDWNKIKTDKQFAVIEDTFLVNGVGLVLSCTVTSGTINKGDKIMMGPFNGGFVELTIKSIHDNFHTFVEYLNIYEFL